MHGTIVMARRRQARPGSTPVSVHACSMLRMPLCGSCSRGNGSPTRQKPYRKIICTRIGVDPGGIRICTAPVHTSRFVPAAPPIRARRFAASSPCLRRDKTPAEDMCRRNASAPSGAQRAPCLRERKNEDEEQKRGVHVELPVQQPGRAGHEPENLMRRMRRALESRWATAALTPHRWGDGVRAFGGVFLPRRPRVPSWSMTLRT